MQLIQRFSHKNEFHSRWDSRVHSDSLGVNVSEEDQVLILGQEFQSLFDLTRHFCTNFNLHETSFPCPLKNLYTKINPIFTKLLDSDQVICQIKKPSKNVISYPRHF